MIKSPHLIIKTPEGVSFSLELAGPAHRFMAALIDLGSMLALFAVISSIFRLFNLLNTDIATAGIILSSFIIIFGYGIILEWFLKGQTLGKKLLKLRVVDAAGLKLNSSQVAIRNLLRVVDTLPVFYMVGGICSVINSKRQRLGDIAAGTVVIRMPSVTVPDISEAITDKYNSFLSYPHIAARLRQKTTPEEADLALSSLLRRDSPDADARIRLYAGLRNHFKSIAVFPDEATAWISDEQYVRNVVEILFRENAKTSY